MSITYESTATGQVYYPRTGRIRRTNSSQIVQDAVIYPDTSTYTQIGEKPKLSLDGSTVVSWCYGYAVGGTGNDGAVVIHSRSGNTWTQEAFIPDPDYASHSNTYFNFGMGTAISADGNTVAIGSPYANKVYIYTRTAGVWSLEQAIANPGSSLLFGFSIDLTDDGNTVAILCKDYVNYDPVYIYTRSGGVWSLAHSLQQTQYTYSAWYAYEASEEICISGDGTKLFQSNQDTTPTRNGYLVPWEYDSSTSTWVEGTLVTGGSLDYFGFRLESNTDGTLLMVAEINSTQGGKSGAGAVKIFTNLSNTLTLYQTLISPYPETDTNFGWGSSMDDNGEVIVGSCPNFASVAEQSVGMFIFHRQGDTYRPVYHVVPDTGLTSADSFAESLTLSGDSNYIATYHILSGSDTCTIFKDTI